MEILWAVQIAKSENFHLIIVGGDVKICFDALNSDLEKCNWAIASRCSDMLRSLLIVILPGSKGCKLCNPLFS